MTLIIYRNAKYYISDMRFECDNVEIYENVENIFMENLDTKHYKDNGTREENCRLILFEDPQHKGLLNNNYVYVRKGDTIKVK